ncbi:MAG: hypothetical protein AAB440_03300 [Patescibacteria group bacterium]
MQDMVGTPIETEVLQKLTSFSHLLKDDTLFTGGHFILKNGVPELNAGTVESFISAVKLYQEGRDKGVRVGLGLLVNDIGMTCDTNVCYAVPAFNRDEFSLPEEYRSILAKHNVEISEVEMYWEKHLRNRGIQIFRRKMVNKDKAVKKAANAYWLDTEGGDRLLLTRFSLMSPYGIAACPLIMGANGVVQRERGWKTSVNFWYVDIDNYENIPNHFMVEKGAEVARHMGVDLESKNIYFTHDKVIANF